MVPYLLQKKEPLLVGYFVSRYVSCKHLRIDLGEGQPKLLSHSFYVNTFVMRIGHVCIQLDFVACLTMDLSVLMCQDFVPQEKLASGFYKRTCYLLLHLTTILFVLLSHCLQHLVVWHSTIWKMPKKSWSKLYNRETRHLLKFIYVKTHTYYFKGRVGLSIALRPKNSMGHEKSWDFRERFRRIDFAQKVLKIQEK